MSFLLILDQFARGPLSLVLQEPTPFDAGHYGESGASFFLMLVQTLLALGLVCGLAYVIFRWVLPRLQNFGGAGNHLVRVVDRVGIDTRKSLYVIEVAGRWLLVASSEAGVQLISELDAANAEEAAEALDRQRPSFGGQGRGTGAAEEASPETLGERFARLLSKRK
ncbi:MAG: flagellar protein FliO/FliZ [Blastocatellia bacterium]|jgi:flagellar protein FliO/FliZ|nr:flagellar protein FliO/FliZ [Blastocatellia bacterium]